MHMQEALNHIVIVTVTIARFKAVSYLNVGSQNYILYVEVLKSVRYLLIQNP